jgi:hypothetical protein
MAARYDSAEGVPILASFGEYVHLLKILGSYVRQVLLTIKKGGIGYMSSTESHAKATTLKGTEAETATQNVLIPDGILLLIHGRSLSKYWETADDSGVIDKKPSRIC